MERVQNLNDRSGHLGTVTSSVALIQESEEPEQPLPKNRFAKLWVMHRGTIQGILGVLAYLAFGTAMFWYFRDHDNFDGNASDAFYLAVVTFLTIGYGDMAPKSDGAKAFTIFFILGGLVVQATVGGYVLSKLVSVDEDEKFHRTRKGSTDAYLRLKPQLMELAKAAAFLFVLVMGGTFFLQYTEDRSFLDSLYWAVVTLTTVGYGDITPASNKAWFAVYFLFGVLSFGFLVSQCIGTFMEVFKLRRLQKFFHQGLTLSMLEQMDVHKDGQIHRDEFMIFMLKRMDIATHEQLARILGLFDTLDHNGDGTLSLPDIAARATGSRLTPLPSVDESSYNAAKSPAPGQGNTLDGVPGSSP